MKETHKQNFAEWRECAANYHIPPMVKLGEIMGDNLKFKIMKSLEKFEVVDLSSVNVTGGAAPSRKFDEGPSVKFDVGPSRKFDASASISEAMALASAMGDDANDEI